LLQRNSTRYDVYASVNAIATGARSRTRREVAGVRHVFIDVDQDAQGALPPSLGAGPTFRRRATWCIPRQSARTFSWRARDFDAVTVERLQKQLAADLDGDLAATSVAQVTRLPGFRNCKYDASYVVWVDYRDVGHVYTPRDFPCADDAEPVRPELVVPKRFRARILQSGRTRTAYPSTSHQQLRGITATSTRSAFAAHRPRLRPGRRRRARRPAE